MPERRGRRRRKSFFQRFKPFVRRLRGKDAAPGVRSPTGVADFWPEAVPATQNEKQPLVHDDKVECQSADEVLGTGDQANVDINVDQSENQDDISGDKQEAAVMDEKKVASEKEEPPIAKQEGGQDVLRGELLRDFSYPSPAEGDGKTTHSLPAKIGFRSISPISWGSGDFSDKLEHNNRESQISPDSQEEDSATTFSTPLSKAMTNESNESDAQDDGDLPPPPGGGLRSGSAVYDKQRECKDNKENAYNYSHSKEESDRGRIQASDCRGELPVGNSFLHSKQAEHRSTLEATSHKSENRVAGENKAEEGNIEQEGQVDKDDSSAFDEELDRSTQQQNPEELFAQGKAVHVDIVRGVYESFKRGQIVAIRKRVQLLIQDTDGTAKQHWLARSSLAYMGSAFPAYEDKTTTSKPTGASNTKNSEEASEDFQRDDRVWIVGGKYQKYGSGTVLEVRKTVKVAVDGPEGNKDPWLRKESLRLVVDGHPAPSNAEAGVGSARVQSSNSAGKPSSAKPKATGAAKPKGTGRKAKVKTFVKLTPLLESDKDWRLVDSTRGGAKWGRRQVVKLVLETAPVEDTLLSYWMQKRIKHTEIELNKKELSVEIQREEEDKDGSKYELVASKIQSDGERVAAPGAPAVKCIRLYYCQVSGPGLQPVSLQTELERIADFGSLSPDKVCSRLEMFLSPAYKFKTEHQLLDKSQSHAIFMLKQTTFCKIPEIGNEGCGFICKKTLTELLGAGTPAQRAYAIQVRGSAGFGLFKGMLMAKEMKADEPPIQIPQSMIKLGPSRASNPKEEAFLVITVNGVHPNSTNQMMGRLLRGEKTTKTFREQTVAKRKFSDMFRQLLKGLKVPEDILGEYVKASKKEENLHHAFVVGLADPTCGGLPHGTVFIPGLPYAGEIFVSRSPAVDSTDGRLVPVVTSKPDGMSKEAWAFLEGLPFGSVIFSNPKPFETPVPVMIADGDLDGDLYFICWNKQILSHVQCRPLEPCLGYDDGEKFYEYRVDWLEEAQIRMADAATTQLRAEAIGKLYNKAKVIAEESDDFMNDKNHKAFCRAYKQALKIGKHGGKIGLPKRLHRELPAKFSHILEEVED